MPARRKNLRLRGALLLSGLSGALLAVSFPSAGLWPAAWVALAPWLIALRLATTGGAILGSWLGGFVFYGILLYWLGLFGWSVWALACLVLSLTSLAWGIGVRWTGRLSPFSRIVGAAALWCGVEWVRGLGQFGFTWGWLGYSQSSALSILPVAWAAGTLGLSFLIVLVNAALAELVVSVVRYESTLRALLRTAVAIGMAALAIYAAGAMRGRASGLEGPTAMVAIVQGSAHGPLISEDVNVPMTAEEERRTREIYEALTKEAATAHPALVVWPESVLPHAPDEDLAVAETVARSARESHAWLLAGGARFDDDKRYNAAYLFAPSGNLVGWYDKVQLVPFGEYVPGREWLPFLDRYNVRATDFNSGSVHRVLQAGTITIGPMICFESIFPQISWYLADKGAQLLVVITNDAWFGHTAAAAQHRQIAVLRAVERNRWVVRAASTGISSFISPRGEVVDEAALYEQKVLTHEVRLAAPDDRGGSFGHAAAWGLCFLAVAFLIAPAALPKNRRR